MVDQELSWYTLLKAWGTTLAIYSLSGATPLLMGWLLEGFVSRIAWVSFIIGFWGVFSGGLIYILKQKGTTMDAKDFEEAKKTAADVQGIAAGQVSAGVKNQEEIRKVVEDYSDRDKKESAEENPLAQQQQVEVKPPNQTQTQQ